MTAPALSALHENGIRIGRVQNISEDSREENALFVFYTILFVLNDCLARKDEGRLYPNRLKLNRNQSRRFVVRSLVNGRPCCYFNNV